MDLVTIETGSGGGGVGTEGLTVLSAANGCGVGMRGRARARGAGSGGNSPVVTFILARMYVELPCGLLLISDLPSGKPAGLWGLPSTVLEGSSGCVCASMVEYLVRQRGVVVCVVSAGLASTSIIRTDGGKMETGM